MFCPPLLFIGILSVCVVGGGREILTNYSRCSVRRKANEANKEWGTCMCMLIFMMLMFMAMYPVYHRMPTQYHYNLLEDDVATEPIQVARMLTMMLATHVDC